MAVRFGACDCAVSWEASFVPLKVSKNKEAVHGLHYFGGCDGIHGKISVSHMHEYPRRYPVAQRLHCGAHTHLIVVSLEFEVSWCELRCKGGILFGEVQNVLPLSLLAVEKKMYFNSVFLTAFRR